MVVAWAAGVIDARGHIEVNARHGKGQPRVRITTKNLPLLERLAVLTGTRVVTDRIGYNRRPCTDHCVEQHTHIAWQSIQWTVDSARATIVLCNVRPFIVAREVDVARALDAGLAAFPPERGDTPRQMAALGWELPSAVG